jgi:hypothetical protein
MTTTLTVNARPRAMDLYRWLGVFMIACSGFVLAGCDNALGKPRIIQQPQDREAFVTQPATFAVAAEGASPLTFQWRKDGTDIPGATSPTYTTPATTVDDAGARYSVVVSNGKGSATSNEASLTIRAAAAIVTQPASQTVALGATAAFTVVGSGDLLSYQWRRNDIDIAGATSATYTTAATVARDDGAVFTVAVRNPGGIAVSQPVVLTVSSAPGNRGCTGQPGRGGGTSRDLQRARHRRRAQLSVAARLHRHRGRDLTRVHAPERHPGGRRGRVLGSGQQQPRHRHERGGHPDRAGVGDQPTTTAGCRTRGRAVVHTRREFRAGAQAGRQPLVLGCQQRRPAR